jgi:hypothetical protein
MSVIIYWDDTEDHKVDKSAYAHEDFLSANDDYDDSMTTRPWQNDDTATSRGVLSHQVHEVCNLLSAWIQFSTRIPHQLQETWAKQTTRGFAS